MMDIGAKMSENIATQPGRHEGMKTICIAAAGFIASWSIEQWTKIGSLIGVWLTALYMLFKCIDWVRGKLVAKRARKKKNHNYYED